MSSVETTKELVKASYEMTDTSIENKSEERTMEQRREDRVAGQATTLFLMSIPWVVIALILPREDWSSLTIAGALAVFAGGLAISLIAGGIGLMFTRSWYR